MNLWILILGAYILIDGIGNLFIKGNQYHDFVYDLFRLIRGIVGGAIMVVGYYFV